MKRIEIIYEDDLCIVINKPAGLAVQGGKGVKVSLDAILAEARQPAPLLVHRLDKDTSGLVLTAKTREAAARFSSLLTRGIVKQYLAVCLGYPAEKEGTISLELEIRGSVKQSRTRYKVIQSACARDFLPSMEDALFSVLEIELDTGRMHQIRRHLALTGNPILGDDKYGDFAVNKTLHKAAGLKRLLLHAFRLVIPQEGGSCLDLRAPVPEYFDGFVDPARGSG
jgi:23S rRNA pseudouridine955/2504/2580 synthase